MSAIPQLRVHEKETGSPSDNPLQLLRDAIDRLNSSPAGLPDQAQVADLLAEAGKALERANVIAHVAAQCEGFLKEVQFDQAFQALDAGLTVYPEDPVLVARRREVEHQQKAFLSAIAVRSAIGEAAWFFDQGRIDLAIHFLKNKVAELPSETALRSRLEELEALLPEWEQKRYVQAALERVAKLEHLQQGQAALTILEEALQAYPESEELMGAAKRVRDQMADQERKKKLARRLELIGQKIAAHSWREALTLVKNTRREFPGTAELNLLEREADAGLRRSECESVATEVRQCLADGETEQAEQILRRGLQSLGPEPALEALREELEAGRKYREELRKAQVLFGRRQLREAESVLAQLADQDRPEAQALLDAVRGARAATEEEEFRERGRERALDLMQQEQFTQAADLLRNLLTLFPGNPILERDLATAQSRLDQGSPEVLPAAIEESPDPPPPLSAPVRIAPADPVAGHAMIPSRFRRAAIAGTASLVLVSAAGAAWKLSHRGAPVSVQPAERAPQLPPETTLPAKRDDGDAVATPPDEAPRPSTVKRAASNNEKTQVPPAHSSVLRPFVPADARNAPVQNQNLPLPLPPATGGGISVATTSLPPAEVVQLVNPPSPPPAKPAPVQAKTAAPIVASRIEEPQILVRKMPAYPPLARQFRAFGLVRVEAMIDVHGDVKSAKVLRGHPMLAAAAKDAVLKWKFKPATLNGQPIATSMEIDISFSDGNN